MTLVVRAVFWVIAYLGAVLSPLVFAAIGATNPDHGLLDQLLGGARVRRARDDGFGVRARRAVPPARGTVRQDGLLQFHRHVGYVGLLFILGHFVIPAKWDALTLTNALHAPLLVWFGMAALLALVVLISTSVWRRRLRLSYEAWHVTHTLLAVVLVGGALGHVLFVDEYVSSLWKQILGASRS